MLHASESDLQWLSSGYFLVLTAAMLPAVQADFARGMDMAQLVSADIALAGIVFTLHFLSASNTPKKAAQPASIVLNSQVPVRLRERKMAKTLAAMHGFCGKANRRR